MGISVCIPAHPQRSGNTVDFLVHVTRVTVRCHELCLKLSITAQIERPPRGGPSNLFAALFVQATACAFRFLRQPSRPKPPMPVAEFAI
jgi:hypothetical protein